MISGTVLIFSRREWARASKESALSFNTVSGCLMGTLLVVFVAMGCGREGEGEKEVSGFKRKRETDGLMLMMGREYPL